MSDKYRKKPVVIEAIKWDGRYETMTRIVKEWDSHRELSLLPDGEQYLLIKTLEGTMRANEGDWIIRGVKGEIYPCKPDIFEQTYEPVTN